MKKFLLGAFAAVAVCGANLTIITRAESVEPAPAPVVYGVLSLIGDAFEIIVDQPQIGTRLNANRRDWVVISTPVLDNIAVATVAEAMRKLRPSAEFAAINTRSPVLFAKQRELFAETDGKFAVPEAVHRYLGGTR